MVSVHTTNLSKKFSYCQVRDCTFSCKTPNLSTVRYFVFIIYEKLLKLQHIQTVTTILFIANYFPILYLMEETADNCNFSSNAHILQTLEVYTHILKTVHMLIKLLLTRFFTGLYFTSGSSSNGEFS